MTYLRFHRRAFVGVQYALFAAACLSFTTAPRAGEASTGIPGSAQQIYADQVPDWIFAVPTELDVCTKSHVAAFGRGYWFRLVDLQTGKVQNYPQRPSGSSYAVFGPDCALLGQGQSHWTVRGATVNRNAADMAKSLPDNVIVRVSPNGKQLAYFTAGVYYVARPEGRLLHVGMPGRFEDIDLGSPITGIEWLPDGESLAALLHDPETGLSRLIKIAVSTRVITTLASGLDGSSVPGSIGVSSDGNTIYLSLVSTHAPDVAERQKPHAPRDLDIFAYNVENRSFTRVVASPFDDFAPVVRDGWLYWTVGDAHTDVSVVASTGGRAHVVADGGQIPYWRNDDRLIAFTVGDHRMADPALNYDVDTVELDANAQPVGKEGVLIAGNHEDFTPTWSPDGKWLLFHSHRCAEPPPYYLHTSCTDGVWLLRSGDGMEHQRLVTPPGTWEVGMGDWSRDGTRFAFSSWRRGGPLDVAELWIVTIDPATGEVKNSENLGVPKPMVSARLQYWSPVADELAVEDFATDDRHIIWLLDYKTRQVKNILEFPSATFSGLAWSADGKRIIYSGLIGGRQQLFEISRDGGTPHQITYEQFGSLILPQVSHDGRWIAATRAITTRELWRLPLGAQGTVQAQAAVRKARHASPQ
jgi:Tol biopolymer transport system component